MFSNQDDRELQPTSASRDEILLALKAILSPGQVSELRALEVRQGGRGKPVTVSGYFDDPEKLADAALSIPHAKGIYFTPNPINPDLLGRSPNRTTRALSGTLTSDSDVSRRRWLLVDVDTVRQSETSASAEEHDLALEKARQIAEALEKEGWPAPIVGDSGNGAHLMYAVDLPVEDGDVIKRVLETLAFRFDDESVRVDRTVYNPGRIWKLYGTVARKGEPTAERPHRMARLLKRPDRLSPVPPEVLGRFSAFAPSTRPRVGNRGRRLEKIDVDRWLKEHGVPVVSSGPWKDGRRWVLNPCPWNPEHTNRSAFVVQFANGPVAAGCHHNGCSGKEWSDLRDVHEPRWRNRRAQSDCATSSGLEDARKIIREVGNKITLDSTGALKSILESHEVLGSLALIAEADRGSYEAFLFRLEESGLKVKFVKSIDAAVKQVCKSSRKLRLVRADDVPEPVFVKDVLPDAPCAQDLVVPSEWRVSCDGVTREITVTGPSGEPIDAFRPVCPAPIIVAGRMKRVDDGAESILLAWVRDSHWQLHTSERATTADKRAIVKLAGFGLPVTSRSASELVEYIAAFESLNLERLPCSRVSSQMGWQGKDGSEGFLCGRTLIRAGLQTVSLAGIDEKHPETWKVDVVSFRGADAGDEQLADSFRAKGDLKTWHAAASFSADYPRVALAIYASLVPPMLEILGAPNFCVDWSSPTSQGKTTALRLAASVWGTPDERSPASVLGTWDVTRVWIEREAGSLNGLPLILDDTKRAKRSELIAQTIYDIVSGRGRGRGSLQGTRRSGFWRTVLLSSGESSATSFTRDGGTRARVLALWGPPFEKTDAVTGEIVHSLNATCLQHYGHAGPAFVKHLVDHRSDQEKWRQAHQTIYEKYLKKAGTNPVGGRLAMVFATLAITAQLAHEALSFTWDWEGVLDSVWEVAMREIDQADQAKAALDFVRSWAIGNATSFYGRHQNDSNEKPKVPSTGWAGKWDPGDSAMAFLPHRLEKLLNEAEFSCDAVMKSWRDRGWLELGSDRQRLTKKVRIGDETTWAVVIRRGAFEQTDEVENQETPIGGNSGNTIGNV